MIPALTASCRSPASGRRLEIRGLPVFRIPVSAELRIFGSASRPWWWATSIGGTGNAFPLWAGSPPSGLRPAIELDEDELTVHYRIAEPQHRQYLGLPHAFGHGHGGVETTVTALPDGSILVSAPTPNGVQFTKTDHRRPTGINDAVRLHLANTANGNDVQHDREMSQEISAADFDQMIRSGRTIATVDDRKMTVYLQRIWPTDRYYMGLVPRTEEQMP